MKKKNVYMFIIQMIFCSNIIKMAKESQITTSTWFSHL
jgi:hypothetical protein